MRLIALLLAVLCGLYAVITNQFLWAIVCAGLVFLAFADFFSSSIQADLARAGRWGRSFFASGWGLFLIGGVVFSGFATWQSRQDDQSRTTVWFWLIALVLMVAAALAHDLEERARRRAAIVQGETPAIAALSDPAPRWGLLDWALVALTTIVAAVLRVYNLNEFLPPMHGDEGEMGLRALLALHGPASGVSERLLPFFGGSFLDHPTLFHYLQAGALVLFGENIWGLRTLSVVVGVLCVPVLYGVGRVGWGRIAAFMAAWLLAVSHLFIQFSRIALNNIETVLMIILVIWLMAVGRSKTHLWGENRAPLGEGRKQAPLLWFALAGLAAGVSQYFYYGSRLIPILLFVFVVFLWFERRITLRQIVVMGLAFLAAYLPLAEFYSRHFAAFVNRTQGVSVFSQEGIQHALGPSAMWPRDVFELLKHQVEVNLSMFVHSGDSSAFYFRDIAMFDPVTALLFWLGVGVVLARVRRYNEFAVFAWFALGVLLAGVFTNDPPNAPRLIVAAPAVFVIAGVFCQRVVDLLNESEVRPAAAAITVSGVIVAATTLYLNYNTYFVTYARLTPNQIPIAVANEMAVYADDYRIFLLGAPNLYADYSTLAFVANAAERHDADNADQIVQMQEQAGDNKGLLVIALPHRVADLEAVRQRYPGGEWSNHVDAVGRPLFTSYRAP